MNPDIHEKYWSQDREVLIARLVAGGADPAVARAVVEAMQLDLGIAEEPAVAAGWNRVEQPGAGTADDPSPDDIEEARRENPDEDL